ncbi:SH3 domain-containing protein [Kockovaella imperatae]|uniref:SH3 domain-containing protein n=1 Tax=Kockovaella imperatae TaxID=4999 RepID=A0A1Y1U5H1_9TREE|nr:SH3 domain-containing protein [Kockovaella imperatae]ORX33281.1 SH3 domain-containing protein [Kockovaella imperatae]
MASRPGPAAPPAGQKAKAVYDYEAAEEGEIGFADGEILTQIEQLDEGWWSGTNANGQSGLFPANYVELIEDDGPAEGEAPPAAPPPPPAPPAPPAAQAANREAEEEEEGEVMVAQYDYDAAEDNEISFKEGERITNIDKVDADWWQGTNNGKTGLFPAAYVCAPDEYQPS